MAEMSEIAKRIKLRREELGLTTEELATRMGYKDRSSITKIEKGKADIPQSKVVAFARALETTTAYLIGIDEAKEPQKKPLPPGAELPLSTPEVSLITSFRELNDEGQEKAIDYVDDLCASGRYKKCGSDGVAAKEA